MSDQDQPKRPRGRPRRYAEKRQNFSFRITQEVRAALVEAVKISGRSLSEEIEFRLGRDFAWESSKGNVDQMLREAAAIRSAAHVAALRAAGLMILRDTEGKPRRVIVDLETVLAEADGISRGLRSGFLPPEPAPPPPPPPPRMTDEEAQRVLDEIRKLLARAMAGDESAA